MYIRSYKSHHFGHDHYYTNKQLIALRNKHSKKAPSKKLLQLFKVFSDPTKFKILLLLGNSNKLAAGDISLILGKSQSSVSHALSDLRKLDLVASSRCGQLICYTLASDNKAKKLIESFVKELKLK